MRCRWLRRPSAVCKRGVRLLTPREHESITYLEHAWLINMIPDACSGWTMDWTDVRAHSNPQQHGHHVSYARVRHTHTHTHTHTHQGLSPGRGITGDRGTPCYVSNHDQMVWRLLWPPSRDRSVYPSPSSVRLCAPPSASRCRRFRVPHAFAGGCQLIMTSGPMDVSVLLSGRLSFACTRMWPLQWDVNVYIPNVYIPIACMCPWPVRVCLCLCMRLCMRACARVCVCLSPCLCVHVCVLDNCVENLLTDSWDGGWHNSVIRHCVRLQSWSFSFFFFPLVVL